jgi:hypothetical protein
MSLYVEEGMDNIWCHGPLLEYIQLSRTFEDDKHFV